MYPGRFSGGITDMLPDRLMVSPSKNGYRKQNIGVNLHRCTCEACGKQFEAYSEHAYKTEFKIHGVQKVRYYCSYKCFRPVEKAMEDKFKADCLGFVARNGRDKPPEERARIRVEKCKRKMEEIRAIRNDPVQWKALTDKQKKSKMSSYNDWKQRLYEAEETLEQMKQMEG